MNENNEFMKEVVRPVGGVSNCVSKIRYIFKLTIR